MKRLAAITLLAAAGCAEPPDDREYTFYAFGTLVELTVSGTDEATAREARALTAARLETRHRQWHAWEPGPLTDLNRTLGEAGRADIPESLDGLVTRSKALARASGDLFNPAIGQLISAWGFHADEAPSGPPPPAATIRKLAAARPTMDDLVLEDGSVRSNNDAVRLDFGAFAKGMALQQISAELTGIGIRNFLLNAGGDLIAAGQRGDRPWRVGIRHPRGSGVLAAVEPRDGEAVFTSGDYERFFVWEGTRYHHIIDPRTGFPARGVRSVTVIHPDAGLADAAATALFVAGPEDWPGVAEGLDVNLIMLVDNEGTVHVTPAMRERLELVAEPPPDVRIQSP